MNPIRLTRALLCCGLLTASAFAENPASTPFKPGETLRYEVVWPSGLSLGEATFKANGRTDGWSFEMSLSASLPALEIRDDYRSVTGPSLCSVEFEKKARHGSRSTEETIVFDQDAHTAERSTVGGGGESTLDVPPCARDGLAYLYYLRQDLANGRIPPPDDVNFGGQYMINVTYAESRRVVAAGKEWDADRILVDITGPASQHSFEIFFGKDAARTPLLVRVPFDIGSFSLKLVE